MIRKLLIVLAVVTFSMADARTSQAGFIIQGGTETSTGGSFAPNYMQGYDFVSNSNQSSTALGFWDRGSNGLPNSFQVGLWDTATQTLLASATIDNTTPLDTSLTIANGQYRYETLASPVALSSGKTYTLAFQVGIDGLSATDSLFLDYSTMAIDANVTTANEIRFVSGSSFTFPTDTLTVDSMFRGNVNAKLTSVVPAPAGLLLGLFGMGSFGIGGLIRRRLASKSNATAL